MDGLLFPIIMLTVTLLGGGFLLLFLKNSKPKYTSQESQAIRTAQDFINVKDIKDKYLYTNDGLIIIYLHIHAISIDLYSKAEKASLIRQLTAEMSDIQYPFKFMAVSRPVDISPLISELQAMLKDADDKRKELLRQEILQMSGYALTGEIVERQFFISIWDRYEDGCENDLQKRVLLLAEKFTVNGISCDVLKEKEIVRLMNLVNNPSYTHLDDADFTATIPLIEEV